MYIFDKQGFLKCFAILKYKHCLSNTWDAVGLKISNCLTNERVHVRFIELNESCLIHIFCYKNWLYVNSRKIALTCCRMGHCAFLILLTGNSFRCVRYFNIFKQHFNRSEYHLPYQFTRTYICTCSIFMLNFNERSKYLI